MTEIEANLNPGVASLKVDALSDGVALLEGSTWWPSLPHFGVALIVITVYLVLIGIKNFWLRPYIMGRSVHMPEPLVFICIILATVLWGILGALLVIPAVVSLAVIFTYLRRRALGMAPFADPDPEITKQLPRSKSRSGANQPKGKA